MNKLLFGFLVLLGLWQVQSIKFETVNCVISQVYINVANYTTGEVVKIWQTNPAGTIFYQLFSFDSIPTGALSVGYYFTPKNPNSYKIGTSQNVIFHSATMPTCPQSINNTAADELTRVLNIARSRAGLRVVYRNANLDQAAASLNDTTTDNVNSALTNAGYTPAITTVAFTQKDSEDTIFTTNPGATVQNIIDSTNLLTNTQVVEIGVSYSDSRRWIVLLSARAPTCGNGVIEGNEQCDTGSTPSAGCSSNCTQTDGWQCQQNPLDPESNCVELGSGQGGCCSADGLCIISNGAAGCEDGFYYGDGASCPLEFCPLVGACCNGQSGECTMETATSCGAGNLYQGNNEQCSLVDCPAPSTGTGTAGGDGDGTAGDGNGDGDGGDGTGAQDTDRGNSSSGNRVRLLW